MDLAQYIFKTIGYKTQISYKRVENVDIFGNIFKKISFEKLFVIVEVSKHL